MNIVKYIIKVTPLKNRPRGFILLMLPVSGATYDGALELRDGSKSILVYYSVSRSIADRNDCVYELLLARDSEHKIIVAAGTVSYTRTFQNGVDVASYEVQEWEDTIDSAGLWGDRKRFFFSVCNAVLRDCFLNGFAFHDTNDSDLRGKVNGGCFQSDHYRWLEPMMGQELGSIIESMQFLMAEYNH